MITYATELGKPKKNGAMKLYILVSRGKEKKRIPFPISVLPSDIDPKGGFKNRLLDFSVNEKVQSFRKKEIEAGAAIENWSMERVIGWLTGTEVPPDEFKLDFIEFGRKHIENMIKEGRTKTASSYSTALNNFVSFLGKDSIDINDINKAMLMNYAEWFGNERERAFELYMTNLQTIHNLAKKQFNDEDEGIVNIRLSPFKKIEFRRSAVQRRNTRKRSLSVSTLRYLWNTPTEEKTQARLAKNAFFLSFCLCGMNAADMFEHIQGEDTDRNVIEYWRKKTRDRSGNESFIRVSVPEVIRPIHEEMRGKRHTWLFGEKYADPDGLNHALSDGLGKLEKIAVAHYGKMWGMEDEKEIRKLLGLEEGLTFYAARHSWSTIAANDCGVRTETIDQCLCHVVQSLAATTYIKKDYRFVDEANGKVMDVVFGQ